MEKEADVAVVIGRFQPFHHGHAALLSRALEVAPQVLLVVGSAPGPRLVKNPFTAAERIEVIQQCLAPGVRERVTFTSVRDFYDEPRWAAAVQARVEQEAPSARVTLVGFHKDASSSYLDLFPKWGQHLVPRQAPLDATRLRELYFHSGAELPEELRQAVPAPVADLLRQFRRTPDFERLVEELTALENGRKTYGSGPFVTVDAIVTAGDRLLLVQRGRAPGKGLWALPGGFLDGGERLLDAAIRELREETQVDCTDAEIKAAFRSSAVFDHPARSQRGRTITHAHYFALPASALPAVEGADDAQAARWVPLSELPGMIETLFDDHFQIIDHFLDIAKAG